MFKYGIGLLLLLISYHCIPPPIAFSMPKKSWASKEQQTWLLAQLADFRQAQETKTTPSFFSDLYQKFHEQWPLASPNSNEISEADGNDEKAKTLKQKASEHVSDSFTTKYSVA